MMDALRCILAACLAVCLCGAQVTLPRSLGSVPGNAPMALETVPNTPYGTNTTRRLCGVYDNVPAGTYTKIALRPPWNEHGLAQAFVFADVMVDMVSLPVAANSVRQTPCCAITSIGSVTWPGHAMRETRADSVSIPEPFVYELTLPAPYVHPGGTLQVMLGFELPWGSPPFYIDALTDSLTYTPMRRAPAPSGCWTLADPWPYCYADNLGDRGSIQAPSWIPSGPGPSEADWICTGLHVPFPWGGCTVEQDLSVSIVPYWVGTGFLMRYPRGVHRIPVTLVTQRIRMGGPNVIALGVPMYWGIARHSRLEGTLPDFTGYDAGQQIDLSDPHAPVIQLR